LYCPETLRKSKEVKTNIGSFLADVTLEKKNIEVFNRGKTDNRYLFIKSWQSGIIQR
jgi:hypothetical protein